MSLICPQCSHVNPDQSTFCIRCGNRLQSGAQSFNTGPTVAASAPSFAPAAPVAPASPSNPPPSFSQPAGSSYLSYAPVAPPAPAPASPGAYPMQSAYPMQQMGAGQGQVSIRHAFAGYGTLIFHHSWLVKGGAEIAANARDTILDILRQRSIPGFNVNPQRLMERGVLMEERDYLVARRGVSTVFIYTAPAGKDLYISRATTALPAISNVRVILLCLAVLIMIIGLVAHPGYSPYGLYDVFGLLITGVFSFLAVFIFLFLVYAVIRSFIHWIIEKDFWFMLRPRDLNDFQLDDIALLEHVTDDTVKEAMKQIGLDASQITPPPMGYQAKRRIRTI